MFRPSAAGNFSLLVFTFPDMYFMLDLRQFVRYINALFSIYF